MGDSAIVETIGLGAFAMAAAPAVVGYIGAGRASEAAVFTRSMAEIVVGSNPAWTIPAMDFAGVPTGIDIRLVVETGLAPIINTGIAHREPGGLSVREVITMIHNLEGPIVGADVVEYNPSQDLGGVTASVAAKITREIAGAILLQR